MTGVSEARGLALVRCGCCRSTPRIIPVGSVNPAGRVDHFANAAKMIPRVIVGIGGISDSLLPLAKKAFRNRIVSVAFLSNSIAKENKCLKRNGCSARCKLLDGNSTAETVIRELLSSDTARDCVLVIDRSTAIENIPFENSTSIFLYVSVCVVTHCLIISSCNGNLVVIQLLRTAAISRFNRYNISAWADLRETDE